MMGASKRLSSRPDSRGTAGFKGLRIPARVRSDTILGYLHRLGIGQDERDAFLHPRLAALSVPEAMADRALVARRLAQTIRDRQKIVVFGDYDCDGMTAAAIATEVIEELGGVVTPLLASRFAGGYGVSAEAVDRILAEEPALLVTCDCGSSDHRSLERVRGAGVDVVVIDHHLVPEEPLPALAFLNPHRPDCGFPFKGLASCGLVLSVAAALRRELGRPLDVRRWLDLVAIGSIADVAPLVADNRVLVRAGLARLGRAERPGLAALMDLIGLDRDYPITAEDVAFRIAPRLNAPGRLQAPDLAFQLLVEKDLERAGELAERVERLCALRREQQDHMLADVDAELGSVECFDQAAIVVGRPGWNHGIVGIVAGRLADKYQRPAIVVGFEGEVGRGSVRGPAGFPLFDALSECHEHLVRFGGHQAAAGVTVEHSRLEKFRFAFAEACARRRDYEAPAAPQPLDVLPQDDLAVVLGDLYLLEPCGEGNPAPDLRLRGRVLSSRCVKGNHLKLEVALPTGAHLGCFGPGLGSRSDELCGELALVGRLRPDRYRGGDAVELLIRDIQTA